MCGVGHREGRGDGAPSYEAAAAADVVASTVTDDDASRAVWLGADGALAGPAAGAVAVEAGTLTPGWIQSLAARVARLFR